MSEKMYHYDEPIEGAKSNIIEKGRYKFKVLDIEEKQSSNGNPMVDITFDIEGRKWKKNLMLNGQMKFLYHNFLHAIGIRNKGQSIDIPESRILEGVGMIDIGVRDRIMDDGSTMKENKIVNFSAIEEEKAPIAGVPSENETASAPVKDEKVKKTKVEETPETEPTEEEL